MAVEAEWTKNHPTPDEAAQACAAAKSIGPWAKN